MNATIDGILAFLSSHFQEDFRSYSRELAEQQVRQRISQLSFDSAREYEQFLSRDPAEPAFLARLLRVRFGTFFRDPLQFDLLRSVVIPSLIDACHGNLFKVWSAACAGGEEAYSLAIVLHESLQQVSHRLHLQIFATDIADDALQQAQRGLYRDFALGGVTLERLGAYFAPSPGGYQVSESLRSMVTFSRHDLLSERTYVPPDSVYGGFDIILCRNFLMYLQDSAYLRVFDKLFRALNRGGVLLLGKAETVPERYLPYLEVVADYGKIYRKIG